MALDLNDIVEPYKVFNGAYKEQMPLLIAEGRTPLSVAGVMERRLNSTKPAWKDSYFFTGDLIAYHPDKKFRVVYDAQLLQELTAESNVPKNSALILEDGLYETLEGQEFAYEDIKKSLEKDLSQSDVLQNLIWKAVARDQALLEAYVPKMFAEMKQRFGYDESMGIYLDSFDKVPKAKALVVSRLENWSRLKGRYDLGIDNGRLVGVAPEVLNAPGKILVKPSLETALNVVNEYMSKPEIFLRTK